MKLLNKKAFNDDTITKLFSYNTLTFNKNIKTQIKKIFNIIYQYHIKGKKILFINVPIFLIKDMQKVVTKTKHLFIPPNTWVNGLITNQSACFYFLFKKRKKKIKINTFLLDFKQKSDLIVNFNNVNSKTLNLIKESCNATIPIISFDNEITHLKFLKPTYLISKFSNGLNNGGFYSILKSILKKKIELKTKSYVFEKDFYTKEKVFKKKKYYKKKKFKYKKQKNTSHLKTVTKQFQNNLNENQKLSSKLKSE